MHPDHPEPMFGLSTLKETVVWEQEPLWDPSFQVFWICFNWAPVRSEFP